MVDRYPLLHFLDVNVLEPQVVAVVLQFDLSRDIDAAARDVQAAINAARAQLPANLPSNPSYRKVNPADAPAVILSLSSDTVPISRVYDLASSVLALFVRSVVLRRSRCPARA